MMENNVLSSFLCQFINVSEILEEGKAVNVIIQRFFENMLCLCIRSFSTIIVSETVSFEKTEKKKIHFVTLYTVNGWLQ